MTSPLLQRASTTDVATTTRNSSSSVTTPPRKQRSTSLLVDYSKLSSSNSKLATTIGNTSLRTVALSTRNLTVAAANASRRTTTSEAAATETEVTSSTTRRQSSERANREKLILKVLDQAAELSAEAAVPQEDQASCTSTTDCINRSISFKMKRRSSITTTGSSHHESSCSSINKMEMEDSSGGKSTSSRSTEDSTPQEATIDGKRSYHSLLDSTSTHSVFAPKRRDSSKRLLLRSKSGVSRMESRRSLLLSSSYHPPTTTSSSSTSTFTRSAPSSPIGNGGRTRSNRNLLKSTSTQEEDKSTQDPTSNTTDPSSSSSAPQDTTSTTTSRRERRKEKLLLLQQTEDKPAATARGVLPRRSKSTSNDALATNTAPMGRACVSGKIDRRASMMRRQKSQPLLLPRQKSLRDLKKSKEQAKRRPSLSRQGSFTTKQSEFAALEALIGKTTPRPNTITITTTTMDKNNKKQTIRKCKSLDTGGFVTTLPSSNDSAVVEVGERRPVALTSPSKLVTTSTTGGTSPTRPTTTRTLAPVTMPSRVGDRRKMMMLQNRPQSLRHLSNYNNKRDQLNTTSEHHRMTTTTKKCPPLRSHSFGNNKTKSDAGGRRGLMLRQGSFVAGSRMRTLRG